MSRILKGLTEARMTDFGPGDEATWPAYSGHPNDPRDPSRRVSRPEPDYSTEPYNPWDDHYRKQDAALKKYKGEVDIQYSDNEGIAPNGERYNSTFLVRSKTPYQGDNEIYKFNDAHWGAKNIVDTEKKNPEKEGDPYLTMVYYVDNHKHGYWKPWKDQPPVSKSVQFEAELMQEGISQEDLANVLFYRLEQRYPDVIQRYGHQIVGDAIDDVASFHAGAEELGTSDIGMMLKQVLQHIEERGLDEGQIYSTGGGSGEGMRWYTPKDNLGEGEEMSENLRNWFQEKWVRFGPDGKIRGDCARGDDSEGKPKCLPQSKAHSLGKKGRASAAARKRREDPNPERSGKAINVATKKKSNEGVAEGSYREGGSITHDGVEYDFDSVMSIAEKMPTKTCSVDKLSWVLEYDTPNKERLERADITVPLIVTKSVNGKLAAIDGLHRLAKAVRDNVKTLPVKYIKPSELESAKLNKQGVSEGSNDKPEAGDKIIWYHSNHYPELEGEVVGWKDGHLIVKSIDPSPRNTEKTVATYRVPKNNIMSVEKQGVAEGSEEQVYKVVALDKSNALKKPTKLNVKASSIEDVFSRLAANDWYALSINGVEVVGGKRLKQGVAEGPDKLQGTPVVSLSDFTDKDTKKNKYGQTVPKKLKKDDPRVKFHKDEKKGVAEGLKTEPLPVPLYHGGKQPITDFKIPPYGVFFSPHVEHAEVYGPVITKAKVDAKKVYLVDYENDIDEEIIDALFDRDYKTLAKFVKLLQKQGYQALQTVTDSEMICVFPGTPIEILDQNQQGVAEGADDYTARLRARQAAEKEAKSAEAKEYRQYGITARKHGGDDSYSWAVFINGHMMVNGLSSREVPYYKKIALEKAKEKKGVAEGYDWEDETDPVVGSRSQWKRRPQPQKKNKQGVSEAQLDEAAPLIQKLGLSNFLRSVQNKDASSQKEIRILSGVNHAMQLYFKTILALNASVAPTAALFWPILGQQSLLFVGGALFYVFGKILATKIGKSLFGTSDEALAWAKAHLKAGLEKKASFQFDGKTYPVTVIDPDSIADLNKKINELERIITDRENRKKWEQLDKQMLKDRVKENQLDELKCWSGYTRVKGVPAGAPGSCKKKTSEDQAPMFTPEEKCPECGGPMFSELLINEKKDACYYKVKSRYKVWPSAYASGALVKCRKKGADSWGTGGKKNEGMVMGASSDASSAGTRVQGEAANPAQQAAIAIAMKKAGQKPKRESAIMKGLVDETLGTPYPGTYEQETSMIRRKGPERITAMTYENKQGRKK